MNRYVAKAVLLTALISSGLVWAQSNRTIDLTYSDPDRPGFLELNLLHGKITVTGSSDPNIVITATGRDEGESEPVVAENGMRRITRSTFDLEVEERDNRVEISSRGLNNYVNITLQVPTETSLKLSVVNGDNIEVAGVKGDLEINNINGGIVLKGISGSVVAHSLNEKMVVVMDELSEDKPSSFSSLNGDLDITLPSTTKATLKVENKQGEVFTSFDVDLTTRTQRVEEDKRGHGGKYRIGLSNALFGELNGGGPEVAFKSQFGDIYIRKGQ